jgi:vacuolar-type H+-ATPase subunit I/STV1
MLRQANAFEEGAYDAARGEITLTVIEPGFNKSKRRFYPAEVLKRDYKIFEGAKMFIDHATEREEQARPEGSVRDWAASLTSLWVEDDGRVRATAAVIDPEFKKKLENLAQHKKLGEMGVSIRAAGEASDAEIEGHRTQLVERLILGRSVDFVTYPSAGGGVEVLESARASDELDLDVVSLAQLRERRPDLIELIESNGGNTMNEVEQLREQLKAKEKELKTLTEAAETKAVDKIKVELKETQEKLKKAEEVTKEVAKVTAIAEANKVLKKLLEESKLPKKAQERVLVQFKDAETDEGMKEAVTSMVKFMKEVAPDQVTDLGGGDGDGSGDGAGDAVKVEADRKARVGRFQKMGLSEAEAKVAAEDGRY